jgi:hypothetical protein
MRRLEIPYATWEDVLDANPAWVVYEHADGEARTVRAGNADALYVAQVFSEHRTAYDAFDDDRTVVAVTSEDEAIARIVGIGEISAISTREGRPIIHPVTLGENQWHYWHSVGETSGALRAGPHFSLSKAIAGDVDLVWQYRDPVWMAGGELTYEGALVGDHVSFCVFAPATPVTASGGGNTGNCNVVDGVIVPAAGNGAYNVDLADCHPVPTPAGDGYWDYVLPASMKLKGTTTLSATPGAAKYHLIAARFDLTMFVAHEMLLGAGKTAFEPQNINASLCLPEWRFECKLHNESGSHTVTAVWRVLVSRYWTTV